MATDGVLPVVIGVDVTDTSTDVVLLHYQDGGVPRVLSKVKETTTHDVIGDLRRTVLRALLQARDEGFLVAPIQVNIGTNHLLNAVAQGRELTKVAVVRLCGPLSQSLPPFSDFPEGLADKVRGPLYMVPGGYTHDGREKSPVNEDLLREVAREIKEQSISNIAIVGIFSPVLKDQEIRARDVMTEVHHESTVSMSHEIGRIGLLERENAAILNECLRPLCERLVGEMETVLESIGVTCPFCLTQNDGTMISRDEVTKFPVATFATGSSNSMRGAGFLAAKSEAIVLDIGKTASDVGILEKGLPRNSITQVKICGVNTNLRMPDVISVRFGGGSYVTDEKLKDRWSSGFNLGREVLISGNNDIGDGLTPTAPDISIAMEKIHVVLENAVEKVNRSKENLPVIIVGEGHVIVDPKRSFRGAAELIIPDHCAVANAIGAALSKVSVSTRSFFYLKDFVDQESMDQAINDALSSVSHGKQAERDKAVEDAKEPFLARARTAAIDKCCGQAKSATANLGAKEDSLEVLEQSVVCLPFPPGGSVSITMTVVGDVNETLLSRRYSSTHWAEPEDARDFLGYTQTDTGSTKQAVSSTSLHLPSKDGSHHDSDATRHPKKPAIDVQNGEWILSEWDIECIVVGAGIYGCGGGGSLHIARLRCLKALREGKTMRVVSPERLLRDADPERDLVIVSALIGSPTMLHEQGACISASKEAFACLKEIYNVGKFKDGTLLNASEISLEHNENGCTFVSDYRPSQADGQNDHNVVGVMSFECAGSNAVEPLLVAAEMNLPVVDADGMSRALPKVEMFIPYMYGKPPYPVSIVGPDDSTKRNVLLYSPHCKETENYLRDVTVKNGCVSSLSLPLSVSDVLTKTVFHVLSSAWRLGDAVLRARLDNRPVIDVIVEQENGVHVISGEVVHVRKETAGGFDKGHLVVEGGAAWAGQEVLIEFKNEYLAIFPSERGVRRGASMGCVPDLITVVDAVSGEPVQTENVCSGLRVAVVLVPSCSLLRQPQALKFVGPGAFQFGDDVVFSPSQDRPPSRAVPPV